MKQQELKLKPLDPIKPRSSGNFTYEEKTIRQLIDEAEKRGADQQLTKLFDKIEGIIGEDESRDYDIRMERIISYSRNALRAEQRTKLLKLKEEL